MSRLSKKQRERMKRQRASRLDEERAALDRDAAGLPVTGPIAHLVSAISAELTRCVVADRASWESVPFLRPFGEQAFQFTGSIRGMKAICHNAASLDLRAAALRRGMLDKAWDGIGDDRGVWTV